MMFWRARPRVSVMGVTKSAVIAVSVLRPSSRARRRCCPAGLLRASVGPVGPVRAVDGPTDHGGRGLTGKRRHGAHCLEPEPLVEATARRGGGFEERQRVRGVVDDPQAVLQQCRSDALAAGSGTGADVADVPVRFGGPVGLDLEGVPGTALPDKVNYLSFHSDSIPQWSAVPA